MNFFYRMKVCSRLKGLQRKNVLCMKLTLLLLCSNVFLAVGNSYAQNTKFTFSGNSVRLSEVLEEIKENSEFSFFYNHELIDLTQIVSYDVEDATVFEILDKVLAKTGIKYEVIDKTIILSPVPVQVKSKVQQTQKKTVTGTVTDKDGLPLTGVTILIKETSNGTITDADGKYSLSAPVGAVLEFSFIGMKPVQQEVGKLSVIDITMEDDAVGVDEVVVVGYGNQKKASVVGSVQSINAKELEVPSTQLSTSFAGRVAGLIAVQRSGEPGADGANFWIRGISTFGGVTTPLIILDGVPISSGDLNNIDPEIIESFSVLKDATATALYGTLGANGVMIITTKTGKNLAKPRINARVEASISAPTRKVQLVDGVTYMQMYNEGQKNPSSADRIPYTQEKIDRTIAGEDPTVYPNINWYDEMFRDFQSTQKAIINITGGGSKVDYFSSLSASHESGMLKSLSTDYFSYNNNISIWRYNFQNNITYRPTNTTKVALRLNVQLRDANTPYKSTGNLFGNIIRSNPVDFPIIYPADDTRIEGGTNEHIMWGGVINTTTRQVNPVAEMTRGYSTTFQSTVIAAIQLDQDLSMITKGLNFSGLVSFKNFSNTVVARAADYNQYYLGDVYYGEDGSVDSYNLTNTKGSPVSTVLDIDGSASSGSGDRTMYIQAQLNYNKTIGKYHKFGLMALYNQNEFNINTPSSLRASLPKRKQGLAGRVTYGYHDKYLAEFNFGYNGSENFAEGHRYGFFPSFAIGYNISNEKFWDAIRPAISHLKFRGSWGLVGNDQSNSGRFLYQADIDLTSAGYTTGINQNYSQSGPVYNRYQNNDLSWEIGEKLNVGVDMQLFDSWEVVFDIFRENRRNIFMERRTIPNFFGTAATTIYGNLGEVENKGFDGAINYNKQINKNLFISVKGTVSYAKNKIISYDEPAYKLYPGNSRVGHSVNQPLLYMAERLFIDNAEVANSPIQLIGGFISGGDIKYTDIADINGETDGKIDPNDRQYTGYPTIPELVYGLGTSLQYKKWDFSVFFQGAARTSLIMSGFHPFGNTYTQNVLQFIADDYWSENNQDINAKYPRLSIASNANNTVASTYWQRDASFVKLKNMEFGYSLKKFRFYISGSNLLTFSKFKLWDPEMGGGSGLKYPTMRTINLGIQCTL